MRIFTTWCLLLVASFMLIGLQPVSADPGLASLFRQTKITRGGRIEGFIAVYSETMSVLGKDLYHNPEGELQTQDIQAVKDRESPLTIVYSQGNVPGTQGKRNLEKKPVRIVYEIFRPAQSGQRQPFVRQFCLAEQTKRSEDDKRKELRYHHYSDREIREQQWNGTLQGTIWPGTADNQFCAGDKIHIKISMDQLAHEVVDIWIVVSNTTTLQWKGVPDGQVPVAQPLVSTPVNPGIQPGQALPTLPFQLPNAVAPPLGGKVDLRIELQLADGQFYRRRMFIEIVGYNDAGAQVFAPHGVDVTTGVAVVSVPAGLWYGVRFTTDQVNLWAPIPCNVSRVFNGRFRQMADGQNTMIWKRK